MASTVFKGGQAFLGDELKGSDVRIDDGQITAIGSDLTADEVIDCTGKAVLPGFFDTHTHMAFAELDMNLLNLMTTAPEAEVLRFPHTARTVLELGITTVRDAGGAGIGFKQALERGHVTGPRMQTAITMLSMTGGHADEHMEYGADPFANVRLPGMPDPICDGVDGCILKTREVIRAGAEVVKISASGGFLSPNDDPRHPNFSQDEMDAIAHTAADLGVPVMAHAHGAEAIKRAVRAGVRSIEHGTFLDEEGAQMMAKAGTWLVATLTTGDVTEKMANDEDASEAIRQKFANLGFPEQSAFRLAVESGVQVAMGTDCPVAPHGTNLRELALMAENGLTPEQAIVATTRSAAQLMRLDDRLGTLEEGKSADVVVVDGDPFEFDTLRERIDQVWKDGIRVV